MGAFLEIPGALRSPAAEQSDQLYRDLLKYVPRRDSIADDILHHAEAMVRTAQAAAADPRHAALAALAVSAAYTKELANRGEPEYDESAYLLGAADAFEHRKRYLPGAYVRRADASILAVTEMSTEFLSICEVINDAGADADFTLKAMIGASMLAAGRLVARTMTTGPEFLSSAVHVWALSQHWWSVPV